MRKSELDKEVCLKEFYLVQVRHQSVAPVAQLDRVPGYEPGGRGFESCRARSFTCAIKFSSCNY